MSCNELKVEKLTRRRKNHKFGCVTKVGMKDKKQKASIIQRENQRRDHANAALVDLGDPWDNVSFQEKKRFGLHYYYKAIKENPSYGSHKDAMLHAAEMVRVSASTILNWVSEYEELGEVKSDGRGKHSSTKSPMDDSEFRSSLHDFVKVTLCYSTLCHSVINVLILCLLVSNAFV